MITVYGYVPAWGIPDISPYVTKVVNYLTFAGIEFEHKTQDLATLDQDSPHGKLPYIVDSDGTKIGDSNTIIAYLKNKYGDKLDADLSKEQLALGLAFNRLIEEHLYWSGIIQPRWRENSGWETYIPYIVQGAEVTPEMREGLDAFRGRILAEFDGQGMGRRSAEVVDEFFRADIDALSDFLGDKPFFLGDKLHSIDASVYSTLRQIADQPQQWLGTGYVQSKQNLVDYMDRIRKQHDI
ncbi:glutathione S-transferase family protein [Rhodococcus sp. WS1]|uniref:iIsoprene-epoxide--glutathione S-transferase n=1 Tax=unclassified Rhodococcus (in: high G+C Gram-positive bacteria) TaxID=192944 RepID=UPI0011436FFB|nr:MULTISPECIES: glutathione S-transferase family protein [unclassified Rhodococcus (in: high G+C Gram-positive bacteria)]ROZ52968.1 glutathione S-transferase family protein [Rhodococcus sp. WS1]TQC36061.1 glutathione S-transferase family protein [Rhodococcus sp. WS7]